MFDIIKCMHVLVINFLLEFNFLNFFTHNVAFFFYLIDDTPFSHNRGVRTRALVHPYNAGKRTNNSV